ncbi:MAG: isoprenylcysteine carboxylmethyltransferase family protein [Arenimonas sp.]
MPIIRYIAIAAFFLWIFIDGAVVFRYKTGKAENRDRFSLRVIAIGNMLMWTSSIFLSFSTYGARVSMPVQIAGLVLMVAGIVLRFTAISQLGRFHTPNVAIRDDHQLMDTGLYRYIRHPSYLGALIAFLGFGLALGNWLGVAVIMILSPCIYLYRIHEEEQALRAGLGSAYIDYCKRTKRLIPGVY